MIKCGSHIVKGEFDITLDIRYLIYLISICCLLLQERHKELNQIVLAWNIQIYVFKASQKRIYMASGMKVKSHL